MLPELVPSLLARGSGAGESRWVLGEHYQLDIISGQMIATAAVVAVYLGRLCCGFASISAPTVPRVVPR